MGVAGALATARGARENREAASNGVPPATYACAPLCLLARGDVCALSGERALSALSWCACSALAPRRVRGRGRRKKKTCVCVTMLHSHFFFSLPRRLFPSSSPTMRAAVSIPTPAKACVAARPARGGRASGVTAAALPPRAQDSDKVRERIGPPP